MEKPVKQVILENPCRRPGADTTHPDAVGMAAEQIKAFKSPKLEENKY